MAGVVTGIGGVFFKARDPEMLGAWYKEHLGIPVDPGMGGVGIIRADAGKIAWRVAKDDTDWFEPSKSSFMINYRVADLKTLVERLTTADILLLKGPVEDDYGTFASILDPEGNRIELWEPKT